MDVVNTTELQQQAGTLAERIAAITIASAEDYLIAGTVLVQVRGLRKRIADTFDAPIKAAHAAHKAMIGARDKHDKPAAALETSLKDKMGVWSAEREMIRQAEERRLRELARQVAETRWLEVAADLERQGNTAEAQAVIEQPVETPVVVVASEVPKAEGISVRKIWKARVVNSALVPREYLMVNEQALGNLARSLKELATLAGVEFYCEESTSVSAR